MLDLPAFEQEKFPGNHVEPDGHKNSPGMRRNIVSAEQVWGQILAGHKKLDSILTPEQRKMLRKHRDLADMSAACHIPEGLQASTLTLDVPAFIKSAQFYKEFG